MTGDEPSIAAPCAVQQRLDDLPYPMIDRSSGIEAELLRLLRDPAGLTAASVDAANVAALLAGAEQHGVTALLAAKFADAPASPFIERLRALAREHAVWELGHRKALREALSALAAAGIEPVLFKGTALAYSIYPNPVLRSRGDTDLIVPRHERARFTETLGRCGFTPASAGATATTGNQTSLARPAAEGAHELDVHWRISDSEVLSRIFTYEELRADAVPLPALAPEAWAASSVHALLLACMHRGAHRDNPYYVSGVPYCGGDRLIWLYDLHLLAESFTEHEWRSATGLARRKGLRGICLDGLAQARQCFATHIPDPVFAALAPDDVRESASDYLAAGPWRQQWLDFQALPGIRPKARHLRALLFPPAEYMRNKYADQPGQWLPWLYARRACAGAWRRLNGRVI
jgi:hypothetical protein